MKIKNYVLAFVAIFFIGCKKNEILNNPKNSITNASEAYKAIAAVIIETAKDNAKFRTIAYQECSKQKYGDYYVKLNELISLNDQHKYWDKAISDKLLDLQKLSKRDGNNDVIIFIPSIENHPEKAQINNSNLVAVRRIPNADGMVSESNESHGYRYQDPMGVIADEYDNATKTCPGYIVVMNGVLRFFQTIDEEFAWEHDVWVIGEEENLPAESMIAADQSTFIESHSRFEGRAEFGGIVKVENWSLVEPWVRGKPEFRILVYSSNDGRLVKDHPFPKWKRKHFDNRFFNFGGNLRLHNWNRSNLGNYTTEKWIELDGGWSQPIKTSITYKDQFGNTVTTTAEVKGQNKDDDLGLTMIQFMDNINQEYSLSGIKIKRSH